MNVPITGACPGTGIFAWTGKLALLVFCLVPTDAVFTLDFIFHQPAEHINKMR